MRDCFPSLGSRRVLPSEKEQHGVKLENTQQGKIAREEELRAELEALNKEAADAGDAAGDEGIDMSAAIAGIPGL